MTPIRIPLSRPVIGPEERDAVAAVLEGTTLALGPRTEELERLFEERLGVPAALVSSGTAALYCALRALGVDGGEVITPSYGFIATAHAIRLAGARPRFCEVDPVTLGASRETVERADGPDVRAVLPVHVFGTPAAAEGIAEWAYARGVPVVEDAAEALGSERAGRAVGTIGDAGVFAFYPNKLITTGEGGLVASRDPEVIARVRSLRNQGRTGPGMQFGGEGFNFRITEMQSALGIAQLRRLDDSIAARAEHAAAYRLGFAGVDGITLLEPVPAGDFRSWFAFPVFLRDRATRERVHHGLAAAGIESSPYFPALHRTAPYDDPALRAGDLRRTEDLSDRGLAIPLFPGLPPGERDEVVDRVRSAVRSAEDRPATP